MTIQAKSTWRAGDQLSILDLWGKQQGTQSQLHPATDRSNTKSKAAEGDENAEDAEDAANDTATGTDYVAAMQDGVDFGDLSQAVDDIDEEFVEEEEDGDVSGNLSDDN